MSRDSNIIFFMPRSASCRILRSPNLQSDLEGQFLSIQSMLLLSSAFSHAQKARILGVCTLQAKEATILF